MLAAFWGARYELFPKLYVHNNNESNIFWNKRLNQTWIFCYKKKITGHGWLANAGICQSDRIVLLVNDWWPKLILRLDLGQRKWKIWNDKDLDI